MSSDLSEARAEADRERERAAKLEESFRAKEAAHEAALAKVKEDAKQQMAKQVEFFGKMQKRQKHTLAKAQASVEEEQTKSAAKQETLAASLLEQQDQAQVERVFALTPELARLVPGLGHRLLLGLGRLHETLEVQGLVAGVAGDEACGQPPNTICEYSSYSYVYNIQPSHLLL